MKKITLAITGFLMALPITGVFAGVNDLPSQVPCKSGGCTTDVTRLLNTIITWVLGFAALIAVLFLIFGGIIYIVSSGNKERAEQAKKTILYSVIGLVVIVLSYFIANIVISLANQIPTG